MPDEAGPHDDHQHPGAPRWVKVTVLVVILIIAIALLMVSLGGGSHGPNRHVAPSPVVDVD